VIDTVIRPVVEAVRGRIAQRRGGGASEQPLSTLASDEEAIMAVHEALF
jgi:hypothetical protein